MIEQSMTMTILRKFLATQRTFIFIEWDNRPSPFSKTRSTVERRMTSTSCKDQGYQQSTYFSLFWMRGNYEKYLAIRESVLGQKYCIDIKLIDFECYVFSKSRSKIHEKYLTLRQKRAYNKDYFERHKRLQYKLKRIEDVSWLKAASICKYIGGSLPYFTNREEFEEIVALYKLNKNIPITEGIFVGLSWNKSKVRFFIKKFFGGHESFLWGH